VIDHGVSYGSHAAHYAIIGSASQALTSDNRDCDIRKGVNYGAMDAAVSLRPEVADIFQRLDAHNLTQRSLASVLGIEENKISKVRKGERQFKAAEVLKAQAWLAEIERFPGGGPDQPEAPPGQDYVPVEVLPTYAGMGGGGSGEGDREIALVPRALVVDILRGEPQDFLLINVRGDSMEPDFRHGDQLLVDKRDCSPAQPGPFALWDGEWGEFVVKNVERSRTGEVRIFSTNPKYSNESAPAETTRIIGRPVWFGRRL
jgi:phage repressor protein C with HTH and peptisase S24 domain